MRIAKKNYMSFTGGVGFDIGASVPPASGKVVECDKNGNVLAKVKTTVNKPDATHFENSNQFKNLVADRIAENYKNLDGEGFEELTVFMPGSTHADTCIRTPNLKDGAGDSLTHIDYSNMGSLLAQRNVPIQQNFKMNILQDSMGIGGSTFKKIVQNDLLLPAEKQLLFPGAVYDVMMTGGGCGIANIQRLGDNVIISGCGSDVLTDSGKSIRVSDIGASVKASLGEFSKWFGMSEKISREVVNAGIGQVIFNNEFSVENNPSAQKLKSALTQTGKYNIKEVGDNLSFSVKHPYMEKFDIARFESIRNYASAIARYLPQRVALQPNGLIITGPFAFAMDDCLKDVYNTSLPNAIERCFVPYSSEEYRDKIEANNFKIICDKTKFAVKDNTDCMDVLKHVEFSGARKNIMSLSYEKYMKVLKTATKVL